MPLLPFQVPSKDHLVQVHAKHQASLDASDTGTGKTYIAAQLAQDLGLKPLVLCPKAVISTWHRIAGEFRVPVVDVLNPEKLKTGKTSWLARRGKGRFAWTVPDPHAVMLVFDEVHQYGAPDSQNALILASAKSCGFHVHMMSATLAESPLRMRAPGYLLGLHNYHDFWNWAARNACYRNPWNGMEFSRGPKGQEALKRIHAHIFPEYGVRISIADLPDFPAALIQPEAYDLDEINEIREAYEEMDEELAGDEQPNALVALLRARQKTELLKCPFVFEMMKEHLEENHSVVVFCNFKDTLWKLKSYCTEAGLAVSEIHGDQNAADRDWNIAEFQKNNRHVCLAIVQAGGMGVSLHDLNGRPRVSIIFPPLTARDLKQALGRIHRAGSLSPAVQKIVFAAGTVEEDVCKMVKRKLDNLDLLNDGDVSGGILK